MKNYLQTGAEATNAIVWSKRTYTRGIRNIRKNYKDGASGQIKSLNGWYVTPEAVVLSSGGTIPSRFRKHQTL